MDLRLIHPGARICPIVGAYAETFAFLLHLRVFVINACSLTRSELESYSCVPILAPLRTTFNDSSQGDCQRSKEVLRSLNPGWPREVEWLQWRYPGPNSA